MDRCAGACLATSACTVSAGGRYADNRGMRGMHVVLLTSLLTELLGQSILEEDLSSVCCCGSEETTGEKVHEN